MSLENRPKYQVFFKPVLGTEHVNLYAKYLGTDDISVKSVDPTALGYVTASYIIIMGNDVPGDPRSKGILAQVIDSLIDTINMNHPYPLPMIRLINESIHRSFCDLNPLKGDL